jgi:hypothetical protein
MRNNVEISFKCWNRNSNGKCGFFKGDAWDNCVSSSNGTSGNFCNSSKAKKEALKEELKDL